MNLKDHVDEMIIYEFQRTQLKGLMHEDGLKIQAMCRREQECSKNSEGVINKEGCPSICAGRK